MELVSIKEWELENLLDRRELVDNPQLDLLGTLTDVLEKIGKLVPSEAGAILLDDPATKLMTQDRLAVDSSQAELVFVTAFGSHATKLPGCRIPSGDGLVGRAYVRGTALLSTGALNQQGLFGTALDAHLRLEPRSVLVMPLLIRERAIGVVVLINRAAQTSFLEADREVLGALCDYLTALLQSFLDARKARWRARLDQLTGLWNNWHFYEELKRAGEIARQEGREVGFIFLDLDNFKRVNDQHGHQIGSQMLQETASLVEQVLEGRGRAGRFGGDEFEIFLPGFDQYQTLEMTEKLRQAIASSSPRAASDSGEVLVGLTASFGVAMLLQDAGGQVDRVVYLADQAMYRAKASGKNAICLARL
jgi:diguanylate cyclase (GGDEF)-like protein